MLSNADKKAYLTLCRNRRRVRRYIQRSIQELASIDEFQNKNDQHIAELNRQTLEVFQNETIKLKDYKDFLLFLGEARQAHKENEDSKLAAKTFKKGLEEMLLEIEAKMQIVKDYCRGRGKVIPFERKRS